MLECPAEKLENINQAKLSVLCKKPSGLCQRDHVGSHDISFTQRKGMNFCPHIQSFASLRTQNTHGINLLACACLELFFFFLLGYNRCLEMVLKHLLPGILCLAISAFLPGSEFQEETPKETAGLAEDFGHYATRRTFPLPPKCWSCSTHGCRQLASGFVSSCNNSVFIPLLSLCRPVFQVTTRGSLPLTNPTMSHSWL